MRLELIEEDVCEGLKADSNGMGDEHLNNDSVVSLVTEMHRKC